jgi:hypothetical protein
MSQAPPLKGDVKLLGIRGPHYRAFLYEYGDEVEYKRFGHLPPSSSIISNLHLIGQQFSEQLCIITPFL